MQEPSGAVVLDALLALESLQQQGAVWSHTSDQLNANLVRFVAGAGVETHINHEVDVLGVVLEGEGTLALAGEERQLRAGHVFIIPRGVPRSIRATSDSFAYLSCHRRRPGLMPQLNA